MTNQYTTVCVSNLPRTTSAASLEQLFRSVLNPPKCEVVLQPDPARNQNTTTAIINLGCLKKAQQAIREINDMVIGGLHIQISLVTRSFFISPANKVYLKNIPEGIANADIYDLLSNFGTIIAIKLRYDSRDIRQLFIACVTLLTEEQANDAIRAINHSRAHVLSVIAEPNLRYIPAFTPLARDRPPREDPSERVLDAITRRLRAVQERATSFNEPFSVGSEEEEESTAEFATVESDHLSRVTNTSQSIPRAQRSMSFATTDIVVPIDVTQPVGYEWDTRHYRSRRNRAASFANELGELSAIDESAAIDEAHEQTNEITTALHGIMEDLDDQDPADTALDQSAIFQQEGAQSLYEYQESGTPLEVDADDKEYDPQEVDETEVPAVVPAEVTRQEIYDKLFRPFEDENRPRRRLEKVQELLEVVLDVRNNLESLSDRKMLELYILMAEIALEQGKWFIPHVPKEAISAADELNLMSMPTIEKKLSAIRTHLYHSHIGFYSDDALKNVLDILCKTLDMNTLLKLCTDEKQFRLYAFFASVAINCGGELYSPYLSDEAGDLILQLKLDKVESKAEWIHALLDHLKLVHNNRYEAELLNVILEKLLLAMSLQGSEIYALIETCANTDRFRVYASMVMRSIANGVDFSYRLVSNKVVGLVGRLDLDNPRMAPSWQQILHQHLRRLHEKRYPPDTLTAYLERIFDAATSSKDFYYLLEAVADPNLFRVYVTAVDVISMNNGKFSLFSVSDEVVTLVKQLELDTLNSVDARMQALRKHVFGTQVTYIDSVALGNYLDGVFDSWRTQDSFYELLEICAREEYFHEYYFA